MPTDSIVVQCPGCGKRFKGPARVVGRSVACPSCKERFVVPDAVAAVAALPGRPPSEPTSDWPPTDPAAEWPPADDGAYASAGEVGTIVTPVHTPLPSARASSRPQAA
jgi:hypothetical protein